MDKDSITTKKAKLIDEFRDKISALDDTKQKGKWHNVSLPDALYRELKKAVLMQGLAQKHGDSRSSYAGILKRVIDWDLLRKLQMVENPKTDK